MDLAKLIIKLTKSKSKISYLENKFDDHKRRMPSLDKIHQLGWAYKTDLEQGIFKNHFSLRSMKSIGLPVGVTAIFWLFVGIARLISEIITERKVKHIFKKPKLHKKDIAVVLPAHNEELVITSCIQSLKLSLSEKQIYLISDGSVDKTEKLARDEGVNVARLFPGQGKGKAMVYLINKFKLFERYKLIFIVDADTKIDKNFVRFALPFFNDPKISVVFGEPRIHWPKHILPKRGLYYVAYRERLNQIITEFNTTSKEKTPNATQKKDGQTPFALMV